MALFYLHRSRTAAIRHEGLIRNDVPLSSAPLWYRCAMQTPVWDWHPRASSPQARTAVRALLRLSFTLTTPLTAFQPPYMFKFLK